MDVLAQALAPMPAGPAWLTIPLGVMLLVTFALAARPARAAPTGAAASRASSCGRFAIAGGVLLLAGLASWPLAHSTIATDLLLYAASQTWILAFWLARGRPDGDDDGGGGGGGGESDHDPPSPSWWPSFERDFREYARNQDRLPA
jgi:hypothetical protein